MRALDGRQPQLRVPQPASITPLRNPQSTAQMNLIYTAGHHTGTPDPPTLSPRFQGDAPHHHTSTRPTKTPGRSVPTCSVLRTCGTSRRRKFTPNTRRRPSSPRGAGAGTSQGAASQAHLSQQADATAKRNVATYHPPSTPSKNVNAFSSFFFTKIKVRCKIKREIIMIG